MLLAAGLGTRLRPLTDLRPKPIVPVANRPLAAFAMDHLAASGVRSLVANTHPQPELVEKALKRACPAGVSLRFSRESTLLGTAGGLLRARALFDDPQSTVVVMNGDTLFAPDLGAALESHERLGAVATMILRRTPDPARFGTIGVDASGWVRSLLGSPADREITEALMFTGVHLFSPEAFDAMPTSGCVIRTAYRRWVDEGAPVLGFIDDSPWADLGTVSEYHRLNVELASGRFRWPGVVSHRGCILPPGLEPSGHWVQSVVGEGARIAKGITLEQCVVWPGSTVDASARHAVLTPQHRLVVASA